MNIMDPAELKDKFIEVARQMVELNQLPQAARLLAGAEETPSGSHVV